MPILNTEPDKNNQFPMQQVFQLLIPNKASSGSNHFTSSSSPPSGPLFSDSFDLRHLHYSSDLCSSSTGRSPFSWPPRPLSSGRVPSGCIVLAQYHTVPSFVLAPPTCAKVPAGSSSSGGDVAVYLFDVNQPSLPTPFHSVLASISVFMALSTAFYSRNSHSVLPVLFLPYWSLQL